MHLASAGDTEIENLCCNCVDKLSKSDGVSFFFFSFFCLSETAKETPFLLPSARLKPRVFEKANSLAGKKKYLIRYLKKHLIRYKNISFQISLRGRSALRVACDGIFFKKRSKNNEATSVWCFFFPRGSQNVLPLEGRDSLEGKRLRKSRYFKSSSSSIERTLQRRSGYRAAFSAEENAFGGGGKKKSRRERKTGGGKS